MKTTQTTVVELDYDELDKKVTKFLKEKGVKWQEHRTKYECLSEEEWGNDQSHAFAVDGKNVDKYNKKEILAGNFSFQLPTILDWMVKDGALPAGTYKIDVCW